DVLTDDRLALGLAAQREHGGALATHLVRLGLVDEDRLVALVAGEYPPPLVDPRSAHVSRGPIDPLPPTLARPPPPVPDRRPGPHPPLAHGGPRQSDGGERGPVPERPRRAHRRREPDGGARGDRAPLRPAVRAGRRAVPAGPRARGNGRRRPHPGAAGRQRAG